MTEFEKEVLLLLKNINSNLERMVAECSGSEERFQKDLETRKQELDLQEKELQIRAKELEKISEDSSLK